MRPRPVRDKIYLPVVRFGVNDSDWKFVVLAGVICYSVPFLFELKLLGFPLEVWTGIGGVILAVAFFNFVRLGRRPYWLQHQLHALLVSARHRRTIPADAGPQGRRPWLK